jgi:lipoprotein-releasing system permease protein
LRIIKPAHLSTPFDIAKKISFQKQKSYTRFIVRLSIAATSISVAAIIITLSIVNGFQESISEKVFKFWGHIRIGSVSGLPIDYEPGLQLKNTKIETITPFALQSSVLSYKQDIEGVVVKGIPTLSNTPFLIKGKSFEIAQANDSSLVSDSSKRINNTIIISDALATKLNIPLDSSIRLYFMNNGSVQQRKMKVIGWYHSGIEEYDRQFVMTDIKMLQQLNQTQNQIDGYTIRLKDNETIAAATDEIQAELPKNLVATSITDYYPQIFDWINVQTVNRNVIISILLIIAIVNLLTCLFILMLERVNMIGTLTALGASNGFVRSIFLYQASFICWIGIGIGTFIGVGFSLLQKHFGWIQLDETAYFIKTMPIKMYPSQVGLVIIGTAVVSYLSFLIPTLWIKKINPAKAIKFD